MPKNELETALRNELKRLDARKTQILALLNSADISSTSSLPKKRTLSAKARKAISDAQKKRWAKVKKESGK